MIDSLIHCFIDSVTPGLIDSWFIDSLVHWFTGSLVRWFIDSVIHWFIGSLIRSVSCGWILSRHFTGISTTICSFISTSYNFNTSLLQFKSFPIGHFFLWLVQFFETSAPARAGHYWYPLYSNSVVILPGVHPSDRSEGAYQSQVRCRTKTMLTFAAWRWFGVPDKKVNKDKPCKMRHD